MNIIVVNNEEYCLQQLIVMCTMINCNVYIKKKYCLEQIIVLHEKQIVLFTIIKIAYYAKMNGLQ